MKFTKVLIASFSVLLIASCSNQKVVEEKVKAEVKNETVEKREDVIVSTRDYIMNSNNLTADQKSKLLALQEKTSKEARAISEEINKTKMVLVKTLITPKVNEKEVLVLKKNLRKLAKAQLEKTLSAIEEGRKIISPIKNQEEKEYYFNRLMLKQNSSY